MNREDILSKIAELKKQFDLETATREAKIAELEAVVKEENEQLTSLQEKLGDESNYYDYSDHGYAESFKQSVESVVGLNNEISNAKAEILGKKASVTTDLANIEAFKSEIGNLKYENAGLRVEIKRSLANDPEKAAEVRAKIEKNEQTIKQLSEVEIVALQDRVDIVNREIEELEKKVPELETQLSGAIATKQTAYEKYENEYKGIPEIDESKKAMDEWDAVYLSANLETHQKYLALYQSDFATRLDQMSADYNEGKIDEEALAKQLEELRDQLPVDFLVSDEAQKVSELEENSLQQADVMEQIEILESRLADDSLYPIDDLFIRYYSRRAEDAANAAMSYEYQANYITNQIERLKAQKADSQAFLAEVNAEIKKIKTNVKSGTHYTDAKTELADVNDQHTYEAWITELNQEIAGVDEEIASYEQELKKVSERKDKMVKASEDAKNHLENNNGVNNITKGRDERRLAACKNTLAELKKREAILTDTPNNHLNEIISNLRQNTVGTLVDDTLPFPAEGSIETEQENVQTETPVENANETNLPGVEPENEEIERVEGEVIPPDVAAILKGGKYNRNEQIPEQEIVIDAEPSGENEEEMSNEEMLSVYGADNNDAELGSEVAEITKEEDASPNLVEKAKAKVGSVKQWFKKHWAIAVATVLIASGLVTAGLSLGGFSVLKNLVSKPATEITQVVEDPNQIVEEKQENVNTPTKEKSEYQEEILDEGTKEETAEENTSAEETQVVDNNQKDDTNKDTGKEDKTSDVVDNSGKTEETAPVENTTPVEETTPVVDETPVIETEITGVTGDETVTDDDFKNETLYDENGNAINQGNIVDNGITDDNKDIHVETETTGVTGDETVSTNPEDWGAPIIEGNDVSIAPQVDNTPIVQQAAVTESTPVVEQTAVTETAPVVEQSANNGTVVEGVEGWGTPIIDPAELQTPEQDLSVIKPVDAEIPPAPVVEESTEAVKETPVVEQTSSNSAATTEQTTQDLGVEVGPNEAAIVLGQGESYVVENNGTVYETNNEASELTTATIDKATGTTEEQRVEGILNPSELSESYVETKNAQGETEESKVVVVNTEGQTGTSQEELEKLQEANGITQSDVIEANVDWVLDNEGIESAMSYISSQEVAEATSKDPDLANKLAEMLRAAQEKLQNQNTEGQAFTR